MLPKVNPSHNADTSPTVKRLQGYVCKACGFDFEKAYGALGKRYIEAHHLLPLGELPEDEPVSFDPLKDFVVLCANCHRMMHRKGSPRTIDELKAILMSAATLSD